MKLSRPFLLLLATAALAPAQTEMATRELETNQQPNFRSKVNLVLVPVVIRDKSGNPIGTLKKEDFELYDRGKLQTIVKFSIEKAGSHNIEFEPEATPADPAQGPAPAPMNVAERYTIFLFDDLHLNTSDLIQARTAAEKHVAEGLLPTERVAVYSTSGRTSQELTDDHEKIVSAMRAIHPSGMTGDNRRSCPPMSYYMADQIENKRDQAALAAATTDTMACLSLDELQRAQAIQIAQSAARQTLPLGEGDTRLTLANLRNTIRMLATMPGQRNLVLVSPGFFVIDEFHRDVSDVVDLAIRNRVTINSLDARGLHTVGALPDISEQVVSTQTMGLKLRYDRLDAMEGSMLLAEIADGTGGIFFQNSNDLTGGFKKLTTIPKFTYILGFSPQNLKLDGSLHALKVKIKSVTPTVLQARRAYYAPKHLLDPAEEAKREIQEALFSREVLRDLPVELHTQYFKGDQYEAKLGVVARVDLAQLHFKKAEGRNLNNLTIVAALFDRDGNFLKSSSKLIEMKLKDETLQNKARSTITIKTNFDVKIGGYVVRLVVRDSEGQLMAAQNGSVVIP